MQKSENWNSKLKNQQLDQDFHSVQISEVLASFFNFINKETGVQEELNETSPRNRF